MRNKWQWRQIAGLVVIAQVVMVLALVWGWDRFRLLWSEASGTEANIVVAVDEALGPPLTAWQNLAQGGEEANWRMEPVVRDKVAKLSPEYIRIDHVFDAYEVVRKTRDGRLVFDWRQLDLVLDDIEAVGAKPFLSLSYLPTELTGGDITDKPLDWTDWQLLVRSLVEHVSGENGRNTDGVYYEVWNEPDLFGGWKYYGEKNYLDLYYHAAVGARAAVNVNEFKLGGPAITAFYPNWFRALFEMVERENLPMDFVSWHRYDLKVDQFWQDAAEMERLLDEYPGLAVGMERIISEWGFESDIDTGYDTELAGAHMVAAVAEWSPLLTRAFLFEIEDGLDPAGREYWGRWGLLTHKSFGARVKPRYKALEMLTNQEQERVVVSGNGSWVRALASRTPLNVSNFVDYYRVQVIMANYDAAGRHSEVVPVTFEGISPGEYRLEAEFVDGTLQNYNLATSAAVLKHEVLMLPNKVAKLTLTPVGVGE